MPRQWVDELVDEGFELLPITARHGEELRELPFVGDHRDPFDRLPIAQARVERIPIVSGDRAVIAYGLPTIW